jgi:hypothetical protein
MRHFIVPLLSAFVLLRHASADPAAEPGDSFPRLRFGVGGVIGAGAATQAGGGGVGIYLRPGAQLSRTFDIELDASLASLILSNYAHVAILAGWSPNDRATLSVGPSLMGIASYGNENATAVGATARADYHVFRRASPTRDRALTLGLVLDGGVLIPSMSNDNKGVGFAGLAEIGWTWR